MDISCARVDKYAVFETTVSKGIGESNWNEEVRISGKDVVKKDRYLVPRKMIWDGVKSRRNDICVNDLICFVDSI